MENLPITVAARSEEWNVFASSNTGILGSNLTQGEDVCLRLFCVCISVVLRQADPPSKKSYRLSKIKKMKWNGRFTDAFVPKWEQQE
jgi:hypothetical protein